MKSSFHCPVDWHQWCCTPSWLLLLLTPNGLQCTTFLWPQQEQTHSSLQPVHSQHHRQCLWKEIVDCKFTNSVSLGQQEGRHFEPLIPNFRLWYFMGSTVWRKCQVISCWGQSLFYNQFSQQVLYRQRWIWLKSLKHPNPDIPGKTQSWTQKLNKNYI